MEPLASVISPLPVILDITTMPATIKNRGLTSNDAANPHAAFVAITSPLNNFPVSIADCAQIPFAKLKRYAVVLIITLNMLLLRI
jgi:hypothetical protein